MTTAIGRRQCWQIEIRRGLKPAGLGHELAPRLKKLDQLAGREVLGGARMEPGFGPKPGDDVLGEALTGVGLARLEHHPQHFMTVNLVHFQGVRLTWQGRRRNPNPR